MSVSGTFALKLHTPIGLQEGKMILRAKGNDLSGTVVNPKGNYDFTGGTVSGNHIEFVAKLQTPLGRVKAQVSGAVAGDEFQGVAKIPLGQVKIEGTRVAPRRDHGDYRASGSPSLFFGGTGSPLGSREPVDARRGS